MDIIIICLISYLMGSIPFGFILTKIFLKKDIREIGSGNIGATNALRTGNKVLGTVCSYCPYKHKCWGDNIEYLPQQQSKAKNPKFYWYAEINSPKEVVHD